MWYIITKVIPVIIGATGTISKLFRQFPSNKAGKNEIKEVLCTLHTYRTLEGTNVEVQNVT